MNMFIKTCVKDIHNTRIYVFNYISYCFQAWRMGFIRKSSKTLRANRNKMPNKCVFRCKYIFNSWGLSVPRVLRKNGDKDEIEKYSLVKKLCLNAEFDEAISKVKKILLFESTSASSIPILNGLLHSLFQYNRFREIAELKVLMDTHGIIGDRSTYLVLVDSYGELNNLQMVLKLLDEMSLVGIKPHHRSYMVCIRLSLKEKLFLDALKHFLLIESVHVESNDEFTASMIMAFVENDQSDIFYSLLEHLIEHKTRFGQKTAAAIQRYFDRDPQWHSNETKISASGQCQNCKESLQAGKCRKPEEHLSNYFQNILVSELQKDARMKRTADDLKKLRNFIDKNGPFTVVVDGLNVAMHPLFGINLNSLCRLVKVCSSKGEKILIIAGNHLIRPKQSKTATTSEHEKALKYINSIASTYFVKHNRRGVDDLFLINAVLYLCREDFNVRLISNDKFMDHQAKMSPQTLRYFQHWLEDHQISLRWFDDVRMKALPQKRKLIERSMQKTTNSWHFPSSDGNDWICVRRAREDLEADV
ncbi:mitochondrial ribonuclease P catalytic subunit-like [Xenia sp. Carnegie-2017]|uniref:mitochondrial ribonuclease P catalytic subunit-like n=1 Tax=Xenia sp. Carnegie-2017 TaxID=2897299 RepID=UPI001F03AD48|nr:mitochondrial ribonuclease P catalytic subunit-like [Xenia sp. Carnegie-2017]